MIKKKEGRYLPIQVVRNEKTRIPPQKRKYNGQRLGKLHWFVIVLWQDLMYYYVASIDIRDNPESLEVIWDLIRRGWSLQSIWDKRDILWDVILPRYKNKILS